MFLACLRTASPTFSNFRSDSVTKSPPLTRAERTPPFGKTPNECAERPCNATGVSLFPTVEFERGRHTDGEWGGRPIGRGAARQRGSARGHRGGHGVGKGKRGRSGRNDSSPPRSLPTSRSLSRPISRKRAKRASKNARQTRPFTSPGIAHSCPHRFFPPSRSRVFSWLFTFTRLSVRPNVRYLRLAFRRSEDSQT